MSVTLPFIAPQAGIIPGTAMLAPGNPGESMDTFTASTQSEAFGQVLSAIALPQADANQQQTSITSQQVNTPALVNTCEPTVAQIDVQAPTPSLRVEQGTQCAASDLTAMNSRARSESLASAPTSLPVVDLTSEGTVDQTVAVSLEAPIDAAPLQTKTVSGCNRVSFGVARTAYDSVVRQDSDTNLSTTAEELPDSTASETDSEPLQEEVAVTENAKRPVQTVVAANIPSSSDNPSDPLTHAANRSRDDALQTQTSGQKSEENHQNRVTTPAPVEISSGSREQNTVGNKTRRSASAEKAPVDVLPGAILSTAQVLVASAATITPVVEGKSLETETTVMTNGVTTEQASMAVAQSTAPVFAGESTPLQNQPDSVLKAASAVKVEAPSARSAATRTPRQSEQAVAPKESFEQGSAGIVSAGKSGVALPPQISTPVPEAVVQSAAVPSAVKSQVLPFQSQSSSVPPTKLSEIVQPQVGSTDASTTRSAQAATLSVGRQASEPAGNQLVQPELVVPFESPVASAPIASRPAVPVAMAVAARQSFETVKFAGTNQVVQTELPKSTDLVADPVLRFGGNISTAETESSVGQIPATPAAAQSAPSTPAVPVLPVTSASATPLQAVKLESVKTQVPAAVVEPKLPATLDSRTASAKTKDLPIATVYTAPQDYQPLPLPVQPRVAARALVPALHTSGGQVFSENITLVGETSASQVQEVPALSASTPTVNNLPGAPIVAQAAPVAPEIVTSARMAEVTPPTVLSDGTLRRFLQPNTKAVAASPVIQENAVPQALPTSESTNFEQAWVSETATSSEANVITDALRNAGFTVSQDDQVTVTQQPEQISAVKGRPSSVPTPAAAVRNSRQVELRTAVSDPQAQESIKSPASQILSSTKNAVDLGVPSTSERLPAIPVSPQATPMPQKAVAVVPVPGISIEKTNDAPISSGPDAQLAESVATDPQTQDNGWKSVTPTASQSQVPEARAYQTAMSATASSSAFTAQADKTKQPGTKESMASEVGIADLAAQPGLKAEKFAAQSTQVFKSGVLAAQASNKRNTQKIDGKRETSGDAGDGIVVASKIATMFNDDRNTLQLPSSGEVPSAAVAAVDRSVKAEFPKQADHQNGTLEESVSRTMSVVREVAEKIQAKAERTVDFDLNFRSGEHVSVSLEFRRGEVYTTFRTNSNELRDTLSREWQSTMPAMVQGKESVRLAEPTFTQSSNAARSDSSSLDGQAARQQQQQAQSQGSSESTRGFSFSRSSRKSAAEKSEPVVASRAQVLDGSRRLQTFA